MIACTAVFICSAAPWGAVVFVVFFLACLCLGYPIVLAFLFALIVGFGAGARQGRLSVEWFMKEVDE